MTPEKVAQLSTVLLGAGVGFTVTESTRATGDWVVTCSPGSTIDVSQVAAVEAQLGITSPITGAVTFQ